MALALASVDIHNIHLARIAWYCGSTPDWLYPGWRGTAERPKPPVTVQVRTSASGRLYAEGPTRKRPCRQRGRVQPELHLLPHRAEQPEGRPPPATDLRAPQARRLRP